MRVAIVGVGNCASSLVQGRYHYADAKDGDFIPGLMHVNLGGYHIRDIEFVAAFDVDKNKVGKDLSEAIFVEPNNTFKFSDVPHLGVNVDRGMTHDGLGKYLKEKITKAPGETADIVGELKRTGADVLVCYLPVGSEQATKWYVEQILEAGVAELSVAMDAIKQSSAATATWTRPRVRGATTNSWRGSAPHCPAGSAEAYEPSIARARSSRSARRR